MRVRAWRRLRSRVTVALRTTPTSPKAGTWGSHIFGWFLCAVIGLLTASCSAQSAAKPAAAGSLKAVLANARARVEKSDVRATGRLTIVTANGARTNNSLVLASHSFPDGLRTLITVTTPDHKRERYLLTQNESGRTTIEALRAGRQDAGTPDAGALGRGRGGDIVLSRGFCGRAVLLGEADGAGASEVRRARLLCAEERAGAGAADHRTRQSRRGWTRRPGAPVYVEAVPKNGAPAKQFVFYDLEQIGGLWLSRQVEAKVEGKGGSTILLIDHGSPHAHLTRKDFSITAADSASEAGR